MMVEVHKLWISLGELVSRKVSISSGCFQQHFSKTPELLAGASWLSWTSKPSNKNKSENPIRIGQPNSKQIRALISCNDNLLPGTEWKLKIDRLERLWGHLVNRFCSILSNETKLANKALWLWGSTVNASEEFQSSQLNCLKRHMPIGWK